MEQPVKDQTRFDPQRTPFNGPAAEFTYLEVPSVGLVMVNSDTKVAVPIPDEPYPGFPVRLPKEMLAVPQPNIRTCGIPEREGGESGRVKNLGCEAAVGGGCPLIREYGRNGPYNMILVKNGKVDSAPCFRVYCGVSDAGRPTQQGSMLLGKWTILTDRTTIPEKVVDPQTRVLTTRYTEVPNLPPWYEEAKVGRFAEPAVPKKKRGRPRKVVSSMAEAHVG